jgi:hypothetical protein
MSDSHDKSSSACINHLSQPRSRNSGTKWRAAGRESRATPYLSALFKEGGANNSTYRAAAGPGKNLPRRGSGARIQISPVYFGCTRKCRFSGQLDLDTHRAILIGLVLRQENPSGTNLVILRSVATKNLLLKGAEKQMLRSTQHDR